MEAYGRDFVIETAICNLKEMNKEETYRVYVTDVLKGIVFNTAQTGEVVKIDKRYYDLINQEFKATDKSADEIIEKIKEGVNKLNGFT